MIETAVYRCRRSRLLYLGIGYFYTIVLGGLGISFLLNNKQHKNAVGGPVFAFTAAALGVCFLVLAYRSATIRFSGDRLQYRAVFRSRSFCRPTSWRFALGLDTGFRLP